MSSYITSLTPKDRFIKGLTMALHNEELLSTLSDSEVSLYKFILDNSFIIKSHVIKHFGKYRQTFSMYGSRNR
jgi:hypothetical protein